MAGRMGERGGKAGRGELVTGLLLLALALAVAACGGEDEEVVPLLPTPATLDTVLEWSFTEKPGDKPGWQVRLELEPEGTFRYAWRHPTEGRYWREIRGTWRPVPKKSAEWTLEPEVPRGEPGSPWPKSGNSPIVRWEPKFGAGSAAAAYGLWYVSAIDFESGRFTDLVLMKRDERAEHGETDDDA